MLRPFLSTVGRIADLGTPDQQRLKTALSLLDSVTSASAGEIGDAKFAEQLVAMGIAREVEPRQVGAPPRFAITHTGRELFREMKRRIAVTAPANRSLASSSRDRLPPSGG